MRGFRPMPRRLRRGAPINRITAISPKIAALYKLDESWGVFGSLARTERMPTLDELYSSDGIGAAGRMPSLNLDKEKATTVELGVTYQAQGVFSAEDSLTAKATLFHNDLTDLIAANPSGSAGLPYFRNINAAKIWGAELKRPMMPSAGSVSWPGPRCVRRMN